VHKNKVQHDTYKPAWYKASQFCNEYTKIFSGNQPYQNCVENNVHEGNHQVQCGGMTILSSSYI
jgi:hypothetical protein